MRSLFLFKKQFIIHRRIIVFIMSLLAFLACREKPAEKSDINTSASCRLLVLGTLQDGGSPHAGCKKKCCETLFVKPDTGRKVVCLGLVDKQNRQSWLFEATPDMVWQMKKLKRYSGASAETPSGIFITHAHIGHYSGLMYLGREAMNSRQVPVYCLPRMKQFLENNGPWSQLVKLENIKLRELKDSGSVKLADSISVSAMRVPHRDEFSETVAYLIQGPRKKVLFIPDIDKWEKWNRSIVEEIKQADLVFIDGTFYSGDELNTRNIAEIPHPFVCESAALFKELSEKEKQKIYFIHFNHTNPLLNPERVRRFTDSLGFKVATLGMEFEL